MRLWVVGGLILGVSAGTAAAQELGPERVDVQGWIVESSSRWVGDNTAIVTEHTFWTEDGDEVRAYQLGGSADGIGMRMSHAPPLLYPGDHARVTLVRHVPVAAGARFARGFQLERVHSISARPTPAGFTHTTTASGTEVYWPVRDHVITYDSAGSVDLAGTLEFDELDASFTEWQTQSITCGAENGVGAPVPLVTFNTAARASQEVGNDGVNLMKFRDTTWCRPVDGMAPLCYDSNVTGLATLFFIDQDGHPRDGEIVDGDIEFNGVDFRIWRDGDPVVGGIDHADLQNIAAHEIGHYLGISHTCWDGTGTQPVDNDGDLVPNCEPMGSLSAEVLDATMYNFAAPQEIKKRDLTEDDIIGVCEVTGFDCTGSPPCEDIDECALAIDACDDNATCQNTQGFYACDCNDGFMGDGLSCFDVDECADGTDDCKQDETCTNTVGGFTCGAGGGDGDGGGDDGGGCVVGGRPGWLWWPLCALWWWRRRGRFRP